eukprot:m.22992 g.22992  ORF g.22992 m.22992 type:complete len:410 (-) comp14030_c0_seq1:120-1349(-)
MDHHQLSCIDKNDGIVDAVHVLLSLSSRSFLGTQAVKAIRVVDQKPTPTIQRKRKDENGVTVVRKRANTSHPRQFGNNLQQYHVPVSESPHVHYQSESPPPCETNSQPIVSQPHVQLQLFQDSLQQHHQHEASLQHAQLPIQHHPDVQQHHHVLLQHNQEDQDPDQSFDAGSQPHHQYQPEQQQQQPHLFHHQHQIQQILPAAGLPQAPTPPGPRGLNPSKLADFFIGGSQGQLAVCERKILVRDGNTLPYLLVRLRGQSNTLPHDANLTVEFQKPQPAKFIDIHVARVRVKAGVLKYDFLPDSLRLRRRRTLACSFTAPLVASMFSKKCWDGVVVRGPRMFVAFLAGENQCHSLPMFVEISPTSNSPGYRDPVMEYPSELIRSFFHPNTFVQMRKLHSSSRRLDYKGV